MSLSACPCDLLVTVEPHMSSSSFPVDASARQSTRSRAGSVAFAVTAGVAHAGVSGRFGAGCVRGVASARPLVGPSDTCIRVVVGVCVERSNGLLLA